MDNWLWLVIVSGILLGFWDIAKKKALEKNSLFYVLALYTVFCFVLVLFDFRNALQVSGPNLAVLFIKSLIVFSSWALGFAAIQNLPISVITPFNTLTPLFTIILGVAVLHEKLGLLQTTGIFIILLSYYMIGRVGVDEILNLFRNKYFYLMVASSLLGAISSIIDKIALKSVNTGQMQFWFSLFLAILNTGAFFLVRSRDRAGTGKHNPAGHQADGMQADIGAKGRKPAVFDGMILLMSLLLVLSDRIYFYAVNMPDTQISVILPLRKISVFVSVILGGMLFKEKNLKAKFACVSLLIAGTAVIFLGQ